MSHFILSFSPEDSNHLTGKVLKDLTEHFVQKLDNPLVVAVPHRDTDHVHVHIACSGIGYLSGKSLRLSRSRYAQIKREVQEYQISQYPELTASVVEHGKAERNRTMKRKEITAILRSFFNEQGELIDEKRFAEIGAVIYMRGGREYGVRYMGKNIRFEKLGVKRVTQKRNEKLEALKEIRERQQRDLGRM